MSSENTKKYSVYQHWDPLEVCIVGRSYPPEFYSWIEIPHVRELFEQIATETEEDYQRIIGKLQSFGVEVLRPDLPMITDELTIPKNPPPMTPRDYTVMIGETFYSSYGTLVCFYNDVKAPGWPDINSSEEFDDLPDWIKQECYTVHGLDPDTKSRHGVYDNIMQTIRSQGNDIVERLEHRYVNGADCARIGRDLYFGTSSYDQDVVELQSSMSIQFSSYRTHVVNTGGHGDGTYCPVAPGLIISLRDVPTYADTFPGWEVVYLPGQSWAKVAPFLDLKRKNQGKWWIPGFEYDADVVNVVETWLNQWTGYVEETVFDVNMLIIDPKNVMVFNYNEQVFEALSRYGITPHVVPFRHRYFWDGGIHCVTSDLSRRGSMQDYFPERGFL